MNMQYGHYSDNSLPKLNYKDEFVNYKTNAFGYRCPEWTPLPQGKKNVVILGCSHTYGVGLQEDEIWVNQLYSRVDQTRLRFWNLGTPGASGDKIVRILYSTEKVLFPKVIIVCWPAWSRRERLEDTPVSLCNNDSGLKLENDQTDRNNFLKNVFFVEKFAEKNNAKVFHCFAEETYNLQSNHVYHGKSLKNCWPVWSKIRLNHEERIFVSEPSFARDGIHYGVEHHTTFANLLYNHFKTKLK